MDENKSGLGWMGILLVVVVIWILFAAFSGNGGLFGNRNNVDGAAALLPYLTGGYGGCNRVSNCEVEKSNIIESAKTQFLIQKTGDENREAIMGQASRIYEQGLQETIFDLKLENMGLKAEANANARFNALSKQQSDCCCEFNRRLDSIEFNMVTRPPFYPYGFNYPNCAPGCGVTCNGSV